MRVRTPATGGQSVVASKLLKNLGLDAVAPARFLNSRKKQKARMLARSGPLGRQTEEALRAVASARIECVRRIPARFRKGKRT